MDYDLKRIVKKIELYRRLEREFKNKSIEELSPYLRERYTSFLGIKSELINININGEELINLLEYYLDNSK